jgi:hypothetical protein
MEARRQPLLLVGSVGAAAIEAFGIDVTRLHWEVTSISLFGAYTDNDPDYPQPGGDIRKTGGRI